MSMYSKICGIDVSKDTLDYCLLPKSSPVDAPGQLAQISNDTSSICQDFSQRRFNDTLFVVESTGTYSAKVLSILSNLQRPVFLVSPYKSKSFMLAEGVTSKNDRQAARSIAQMGRSLSLRLYKAPSEQMQKRKQVLSTLRALQKQQQMLSNQIHALEQYSIIDDAAINALKATLKTVTEQIDQLEQNLNPLQKEEAFQVKMKYATSIVGIGPKTAECLLILTNNLQTFEHAGQVAKFLGIVNWSHKSGTSVRTKAGY